MEPSSAGAGFLSAVPFAAVAVLYAQALKAQRSSLFSAARTPRARRSPGMSPQSVRLPAARSLFPFAKKLLSSTHRYTVLSLTMLL
jgi:hypothetical protein